MSKTEKMDVMERLLKKYEAATNLIAEMGKELAKYDPEKTSEFIDKVQKILEI